MKKAKPLAESKVRTVVTEFLKSFPFFETLTSEELLAAVEHITWILHGYSHLRAREADFQPAFLAPSLSNLSALIRQYS